MEDVQAKIKAQPVSWICPYLNFVGPGEEYEEGEDIAQEFTVARGTGQVIMRCLKKFGFKIIEMNIFYWSI